MYCFPLFFRSNTTTEFDDSFFSQKKKSNCFYTIHLKNRLNLKLCNRLTILAFNQSITPTRKHSTSGYVRHINVTQYHIAAAPLDKLLLWISCTFSSYLCYFFLLLLSSNDVVFHFTLAPVQFGSAPVYASILSNKSIDL